MGQNRFAKNYRLIPLLIGSLIVYAVIFCLALLIMSVIVYLSKDPIAAGSGVPVVIWLILLALATILMTALTRGGTVFPGIFLALVTTIVSCFYASAGAVTFGGVLLKLLISLLVAVIAFIAGKLIFRGRRFVFHSRKPARAKKSRLKYIRKAGRTRAKHNQEKAVELTEETPTVIRMNEEDLARFIENMNEEDK